LIAEQRKAKEVGDIGEIEKHGVFTGRYVRNPYNQEALPVWVANYILMDYGTGAIMSVPAHDERDYEFAKKIQIAGPARGSSAGRGVGRNRDRAAAPRSWPKNGLLVNSGQFSGLTSQEALKKMAEHAEKNGFGKATVTFVSRTGVSRVSVTGHADPNALLREGWHRPVPEKDLPVILPDNVDITLTGGSPLDVCRVCQRDLPQVRRSCAARDRHHGHVR